MSDHLSTDVAIVGAGPVGLFAVFQCGMLRMRCVLIDALGEAGGQCAALYPEKPIYDIPAWPAIDGGELVRQLERQIAPFGAPRLLNRRVEALAGAAGGFTLTTDRGELVAAKAVVLAAGAGAFGPNRPPLAGLSGFEDSGAVQYYVRRREDFRGKRVVVAGGGDSAVDWALALKDIATVAVVHRRRKFRAAPEMAARLDEAAARGEVELVVPYQLHGIRGEDGALTGVEVATLEGSVRTIPGGRAAAVLRPFDRSRPDRRLGPRTAAAPYPRRPCDLCHQPARRVRDRRCRDLPGQAQADPAGLLGSRDGGARDAWHRASGRGAAFRILDDEGDSPNGK